MSLENQNKVDTLRRIIQECADKRSDFFESKGAGLGDHATNQFITEVRLQAKNEFGQDFSEQAICGINGSRVDFYFPDEATIVEIALGLKNPLSEFEKDILKALLAQENHSVNRLILIGKLGAVKQCSQPARKAFSDWVFRHHGLKVEVYDIALPR